MNGHQTLYNLTLSIRNALQDAFPETLWVVAEISELKENRTGHCYLELVEKDELSDEIKARARATIWSYSWRMIRPYFESVTGRQLTHGIKVLLQASVEYHPAYGLSLNIKDIDPSYTLGDMVRRRTEIIRQLTEAGIINMNKELPLPLVPQRIAVISSETAAGYQDFAHHLETNPFGFSFTVELFEAFMQGSEAAPTIMTALDRIFSREDEFDAVAIIRGGGATADLSCFDNFDLAYTVAQFPLPVVTGIGHEKDDTIIDLVAHTRLKTPTAVAEFFISGALTFHQKLSELKQRINLTLSDSLEMAGERLSSTAGVLLKATEAYLKSADAAVQKSGHRLQQGVVLFTYSRREQLQKTMHRLMQATNRRMNRNNTLLRELTFRARYSLLMNLRQSSLNIGKRSAFLTFHLKNLMRVQEHHLINFDEKLRILNPDNILKRGYTITSQQGKIVTSVAQISDEANLETRFADGSVNSKIIKSG
jgi:exodeoxyribonuclease VII large subunit